MSKLPDVGTSIFSVMSKMAQDHGAINLAQGFPNFPIDPALADALVVEASSILHQYAPMGGNPALLELISQMTEERYQTVYKPTSEILVTAGAAQALYSSIQALVQPGQEVVILDPSYDSYNPAVRIAGGIPVHIPLTSDYRVDWQLIESKISKNTRLIIINNPHNPAGTLWSQSDFEQLETLVSNFPELLVLSDEVYEYISFEKPFISIKSRQNLIKRAICVSSFGKTFHITGWKIGYLVGPEHLVSEIKKLHQFQIFCVNSVGQNALARYIPQADFSAISEMYQAKRDLFMKQMADSRFDLLPSEGSFFILAKYDRISQESDIEFTERLVKEHGVAAVPTSVFYADKEDRKTIRFCFAKTDETLIKSAEILCKI